MNQKPLLYGVIGLLLGIVLTMLSTGSTKAPTSETTKTTTQGMMGMDSSMDDMMGSMMGKKENDFDQAFLSAMIVHHEGAVEMAEAALQSAKHDELKKMAQDIIEAQTKEIKQMKQWQIEWAN